MSAVVRRAGGRVTRRAVCALCLAPMLLTACAPSLRDGAGDATITARVRTALLNAPRVARFQIEVETFSGVVMLTGEVDSRDAEAAVVSVTRYVEDVREVRSSLRVVP
jgi:osmotically-inducible protein OsmY